MRSLAPFLACLAVAACEATPTSTVEYRPGESGTVDHALCLLGFTATPLRELPTGHHLVEVQLNGRTAQFILDTGANFSVVHAPLAAEFDLEPSRRARGAALGVGGALKAGLAQAGSLQIGPVDVRSRQLMTADLSQIVQLGEVTGSSIAGIIGQDVMREHRAVIDVARPILYLMAPDQDPAPVAAERCRASAAGEQADQ